MNKHLRLARLIEMVSLIKYHPDWGAKKLSEYFGISEKRIFDDINELNAGNIPIVYNGKGYSFLTPQHLPPVQFTMDEALALLISSTVLEGRRQDASPSASKSASTKLLGLLPESTRQYLLELTGKVKVDTKGSSKTDPSLKNLNAALAEKRTAAFGYHSFSSGEMSERTADPLGLVFRGNSWYMIAYCHTRREIRTFRLNRMTDLRLTDDHFIYPDEFSIEQHLDKSWQIFQGSETEVAIIFSEKIAPLITEHQWQPDQKIVNNSDGSITFTTTVKGTLEIQRWILSWGAEAEALAPAELRRDISSVAAALNELYNSDVQAGLPAKSAPAKKQKYTYEKTTGKKTGEKLVAESRKGYRTKSD